MTSNEQLQSLVHQMPDPSGSGMYTENIDKEKIEAAVAAIFEGGREYVQGLIDMLDQPGSEADVKPHYALHCVLNHALIAKDDKARREFAATLAQNLSRDLPVYHKSYLCQELQWMGREEAVASLGQLLLDEQLVEAAAMALVAIKTGATAELRRALPEAKGKCLLNIIDALAALAEPAAQEDLNRALASDDQEVRITARAGLARFPNDAAAEAVVRSASNTTGWERMQAAKCCLLAAETMAAAGKPALAASLYDRVAATFTRETEAHVREAAALGNSRLTL